jgi:hypothetical protein
MPSRISQCTYIPVDSAGRRKNSNFNFDRNDNASKLRHSAFRSQESEVALAHSQSLVNHQKSSGSLIRTPESFLGGKFRDEQLDNPKQRQENDDQACDPGDDVKGAGVSIGTHQIFAITKPYHEDQDNRQKNTIDHL